MRGSKYTYRGYTIMNQGYYPPDRCVWWEAVKDNNAYFHGHTLREVIRMIDDSFRDDEVKQLKTKIDILEKALDPIKKCNMSFNIDKACCFDQQCIDGNTCCMYNKDICWVKFIHAVRDARNIIKKQKELV